MVLGRTVLGRTMTQTEKKQTVNWIVRDVFSNLLATGKEPEMGMTNQPVKTLGLPNGERIRELRTLLGLTQLELASRLDCSERLIRKMEKCERVSSKSLAHLCKFFRQNDLKVNLCELVSNSFNPAVVAAEWFTNRFIKVDEISSREWFAPGFSPSPNTALKLELLQRFTEASRITSGKTLVFDQTVAISFYLDRHEGSAVEEPDGCVWLTVDGGKIKQLQLILDSEFDWRQKTRSRL